MLHNAHTSYIKNLTNSIYIAQNCVKNQIEMGSLEDFGCLNRINIMCSDPTYVGT